MKEIATICFSSKGTILKYLNEYDIPTRQTGRALRPANPAFGQKALARQLTEHKREQEVLKNIESLKEKGFSNQKIAEVLNTMKIPTKTGLGKWHRKTIWEILRKT